MPSLLTTPCPHPRDSPSPCKYMAFMISRETENVKSSEGVRGRLPGPELRRKPYVTKEELYQGLGLCFWGWGGVCPLKGKSPGKAGPELGGRAESSRSPQS